MNDNQRNDPSRPNQMDVYVVSIGDMTSEKMELLNELWKHGIRAKANFGNEVGQDVQDHCTEQNIRFLVTFKKGVYSTTQKVKVKDFETKQEKDEARDSIIEHIKSRLKSSL